MALLLGTKFVRKFLSHQIHNTKLRPSNLITDTPNQTNLNHRDLKISKMMKGRFFFLVLQTTESHNVRSMKFWLNRTGFICYKKKRIILVGNATETIILRLFITILINMQSQLLSFQIFYLKITFNKTIAWIEVIEWTYQ